MNIPNRKNIRLQGCDYAKSGGYYVTICTYGKRCILSHIEAGITTERAKVKLTELGEIVEKTIYQTAEMYGVRIPFYVIMPNHIHLILLIDGEARVPLGRMIGALKSLTVMQWREVCNVKGLLMGKIWQRNYYDHILRNELDFLEKLRYMDTNPEKWCEDELFVR